MRNINPWDRRKGARQPGESALTYDYTCCEPILVGRPVYHSLPAWMRPEADEYYDTPRIILEGRASTVDVYFMDRYPWLRAEYDALGSYIGVGSGVALTYDGDLLQEGVIIPQEGIYIRSATIKWRSGDEVEFNGVSTSLPENASFYLWINGQGILQISSDLPDRLTSSISTFFCDEDFAARALNNYEITLPVCRERILANSCDELSLEKVCPLYRITTTDSRITSIEDLRFVDISYEPPLSKYITTPMDTFFQEKREQIENFFTDYLNPLTLGYHFIGCDFSLRRRPSFTETLLSHDAGVQFPATSTELQELDFYTTRTHQVLDWLAQHFGFIDDDVPLFSNWHIGRESNGIGLSLLEKRVILANGFTAGDKSYYPFNAYVQQGYGYHSQWGAPTYHDWTRWRGIQRMKGTHYSLHFMFDVLGLNGTRFGGGLPLDATIPLRIRNFPRAATSDVEIPNGNIAPLEVGIGRVSTPDARPQVRIPNYYDRTSEAWARAKEVVNVYSPPDSIKFGYFLFAAGQSQLGEPLYGTKEETGTGYEETHMGFVPPNAGNRLVEVALPGESDPPVVHNITELFDIETGLNVTFHRMGKFPYFDDSRLQFDPTTEELTISRGTTLSPVRHAYRFTLWKDENPFVKENVLLVITSE